VSTKFRDTRSVTDSLTANMNMNFTCLAESTSAHMDKVELTVARRGDSLSQHITVSQQSILNELRQVKELISMGNNYRSPHLLPDPVLNPGLSRRRSRRRYESSI
jgi:hypothetical protein